MLASNPHEHKELQRLAEARFRDLLDSEIKLLLAAPKGEIAFCGPSDKDSDPNSDPAHSDSWGPERQIRAVLLRWLCVDRDAINHVDPRGIRAHGASITGELDLSFVSVPFFLSLNHCGFSGHVNLHFIEIPAINLSRCVLPSLYASYATVKGSVTLEGLQTNGVVRLYGAHIDGNLECNGAKFSAKFSNTAKAGDGESGIALHAEGAKIAGHIFLSKRFLAKGEVRLFAAEIGRNIECDESEFRNPPLSEVQTSGIALNAEHAKVGGGVHLRNNFVSEGEVRFFGAEIGGNLDCDGGKFQVPKEKGVERAALNAESVKVTGSAYFRGDFSAKGKVRLYHAQIGRNLECHKPIGENLESKSPRFETLDLTHASAGAILDDEEAWPQVGSLLLDGLTYGRISYGPATADKIQNPTAKRLEWLARHRPFSRRPYRQFAKVLSEAGDDQGARRVCAEMERRAWGERRWYWQPVSYVFRATVGYGYFSLRALWWLLGLVALGWAIYYQGYLAGSMVPTEKDSYDSLLAHKVVPTYYPTFHASAYSFENSFPLVKLGVQDKWMPGPGLQRTNQSQHWWTSPDFLLRFKWGQICVGWLLATLFVGGITGIIRRG